MSITISIINLLDGSTKGMNVNGSVTPKVYKYSPGEDLTVNVRDLRLILEDAGDTALNKFGALSALTNGLLIETVINGNTVQISNIKDNSDLITAMSTSHFGSSATDTLGGSIGFGSSSDVFIGKMEITSGGRPEIQLTGSDEIRITVRDNLSSLGTLQTSICVEMES